MLLLAMMLETMLSPLSLMGALGIYIALYLTIVANAMRTARRLGTSWQPKCYNHWCVYLTCIVVAPFVLHPAIHLPLRTAPVLAFKIASEDMQQTLRVGDHILAKPLHRHHAPLRRHDIIVFRHPWDETRTFLKRIVALPGEQVEIRQG
jgi:signal peptidase I